MTATRQIKEIEPQQIATHCPYCALQCGILMSGSNGSTRVVGDARFAVNRGSLCIKGWTAAELLSHPDRLLQPLKRNARGVLVGTSWDDALDTIACAFKETQAKYGKDAVAVLGGGSLTNEKAYLLGKFARVGLQTASIDYNGRYCMSSAAAAGNRAFGIDRGLPFPVSDIPLAEVIMLIGSNPQETMPPLMQYFEAQRANGGSLIVVDPRITPTGQNAQLRLQVIPGTDAVLANGILQVLISEGLIDADYIESRTEGFGLVRSTVASYWPERVERITGVPENMIRAAARMLANRRSAMILTARGPEQQARGVENTLAYINVALALGLPGKPFSGFGTITGQANGQGGRELGQKADQLPGYRSINDPVARRHVAAVWGVDEAEIPGAGKSAFELICDFGTEIRSLLSIGFNFTVSSPDANSVEERLSSLDFFCTADFFLSETARYADVVLPAAQWAEEEGTLTNLEGRVIRRRRTALPPAEVRTDLEFLCDIAARLGRGKYFDYTGAEEIFGELRRATSGGVADYSGVTYKRLDAGEAIHWPCPNESHPGTPRLFADSFPTSSGRARFYAIRSEASSERDSTHSLYLTTGRVLAQYQSGNQTRRIEKLIGMSPEPSAEFHPRTARHFGLSDGQIVQLESRRGSARFKVKITNTIRQDTVFVPFHWGDQHSANRLTSGELDPISRIPAFKACKVTVGERVVNPTINEGPEAFDAATRRHGDKMPGDLESPRLLVRLSQSSTSPGSRSVD